MKKHLARLLICSVSLLFGCSHHSEETSLEVKLSPNSGKADVIAQYGQQEILLKDVLESSVNLKELYQQQNAGLIISIYNLAAKKADTLKKPVDLVIFLPEFSQKDVVKVLAQQNIKYDPKIVKSILFLEKETAKASATDRIVGTIDGQDISFSEVNNPWLFSLYKNFFQQLRSHIEARIVRGLVLEAANKAQIPLQQFIDQKILKGQSAQPTDAELNEKLMALHLRPADLTDSSRKALTESLKQEKAYKQMVRFARSELDAGPVELFFASPTIQPPKGQTGLRVFGAARNPLKVYLVGGFSCEDCPSVASLLEAVSGYLGDIELLWIPFGRVNAGIEKVLADSVACVQASRPKVALEWMKFLYQGQDSLNQESQQKKLESLGLNYQDVQKCVLSRPSQSTQAQEASFWGGEGSTISPLVWVGGEVMAGRIDSYLVNQALKSHLDHSMWGRLKSWFRSWMNRIF